MRTFLKDSEDIIKQGIDWQDRLISQDTVTASTWTVQNGLAGSNATFSDFYTDIDLSGGQPGTQYRVSNQVTTSQGYKYTKSFYVQVVNR